MFYIKNLSQSLLLTLFLVNFSYAKDFINLGFTGDEDQFVSAKILKEIYTEAGLKLKITAYPAPRLTRLIEQGVLDGEVARISDYYTERKNLIMIKEPFYSLDAIYFIKASMQEKISKYEDLCQYKVGIFRGVKFSKDLTSKCTKIYEGDTLNQLLKLLNNDKVDAIVDTEFMWQINSHKKENKDIIKSKVIQSFQLFTSLRMGMEKEAEILEKTIIRLKKSGKLKKIVSKCEQEVINGSTVDKNL